MMKAVICCGVQRVGQNRLDAGAPLRLGRSEEAGTGCGVTGGAGTSRAWLLLLL